MKGRWLNAAAGGAVVLALVAWSARALWSSDPLPVAQPIVVDHAYEFQVDRLRRNETLSHLFGRHAIAGGELLQLLDAADGLNPRRVPAGKEFEFRYAVDTTTPDRVTVRLSDDEFLKLRKDSDGWRGEHERIEWVVENELVFGEIEGSFYETIHRIVPDSILPYAEQDRMIWTVAEDVYGWEIDFTRDVYPGDEIRLLFQRLRSSLGEVRFGRLVAASVETRGVNNPAYLLPADGKKNAYYDERGRSLRRAFRRYPVRFRRISSGFSRRRFHPILHRNRAHLGVDYAADSGSEIFATGDGVVTFAGRDRGYGIVVRIRHPRGIETRYAHMSRVARGIRPGVKVKQGQRIGFVGMSGLANGPHVHYEFLKNGHHVNPRRVDLGDGAPVPAARRREFESLRARYDSVLGLKAVPASSSTEAP